MSAFMYFAIGKLRKTLMVKEYSYCHQEIYFDKVVCAQFNWKKEKKIGKEKYFGRKLTKS